MINHIFPISNSKDFEKLVPHRDPILLLSEINSYSKNSISASYIIEKDCVFVENNVFVEAGIIEHMAQTLAAYNGLKNENQKQPSIGYLVAVNNFTLEVLPRIGETIITTGIENFSFGGMSKFQIESKIDNKIISTAELTTAIENTNF